jgi:cell division septum initiation protein DivIVA
MEARRIELETELEQRRMQVSRLAKWEKVADAVGKAQRLLESARAKLVQAESDARNITTSAQAQADRLLEAARAEARKAESEERARAIQLGETARNALARATEKASQIIADANKQAESIAGKAYEAMRHADLYERTVKAMKNIIDGYGDQYLKPAESLLDDLAEEFAG